MEVFAKRNPDLNVTDLACNPACLIPQANTQILKDDVWFPGNGQDEVNSMCSLRQVDNFKRQSTVSLPLPLTDKLLPDDGGQGSFSAFNHNSFPRRNGENMFSEQRIAALDNALPWKRPADLGNTNNSSKSEGSRLPGPCGRWGHVMFGTLFDPRRTFPGFGFMYSRQVCYRQAAYRLPETANMHRYRKEPPTFGYLDPSAMMCEYLHNYRNFLRDLRVGMRRGKNYEQAIQWGLNAEFPPYLRPPVYTQNSSLQLPRQQQQPQFQQHHEATAPAPTIQTHQQQQQQQQHPYPRQHQPPPDLQQKQEIPDVSPGLWSVLSEITTPQSRDLQIEFSRMMNTVTSTHMRKIWMEKQPRQETVSPASRTEAESPSYLKETATYTKTHESGECGERFADNEANLMYRVNATQQVCEVSRSQFFSNNCQESLQTSLGEPEKGFESVVENEQFRRDLLCRHSFLGERARRPFPFRHHEANEEKQLGKKTPNDDEDDISSLIDNARLELQIEEDEEEEVKQNLRLLMNLQQKEEEKFHSPSGEDGLQSACKDSLQSPCQTAGAGKILPCCDTSSSKPLGKESLEEGKEQLPKGLLKGSSISSASLDLHSDLVLEEPERQVLFVLRKSTVNHHLSQDLQQGDVISCASYPTFSQSSSNWATMSQPCYSFPHSGSASACSECQDECHCNFQNNPDHLMMNCSSTAAAITAMTEDNIGVELDTSHGHQAGKNTLNSDSNRFGSEFSSRFDYKCSMQYSDEVGFHGNGDAELKPPGEFPKAGSFPSNSPNKIRILGSKSYSEAYNADRLQNEGNACSGQVKAEKGGPKESSNRKPIVVSVRPLSHAARRGHHSYLTQRHSNRHRHCQNKQNSSRHRQECRSSDCGAMEDLPEEPLTPAAMTEAKGRPVSLCATQSAHETQALLTDQELLVQRRSASESDVFYDSDQRNRTSTMVQTSGSGDTTCKTASATVITSSLSSQASSNPNYTSELSGSCSPGDPQRYKQREGQGCSCADKLSQQSCDVCSATCQRNNLRQSPPRTAVSGMGYSGTGTVNTDLGVGWKLAKRQSTIADQERRAMEPDMYGSPSVVSCGCKSGVIFSSVEARSILNSYASSQCHVAGQAVYNVIQNDSRSPIHNCSTETSRSVDSKDSCVYRSDVLSSCRETENIVLKPYTQVFPQEKVQEVPNPCPLPSHSIGVVDGESLPLSEAAFAEHIACSAIRFQSNPFHKYWKESGQLGPKAFDTCFPLTEDSPTSSMILKVLQRDKTDQRETPRSASAANHGPLRLPPSDENCVYCDARKRVGIHLDCTPPSAQSEHSAHQPAATNFNSQPLITACPLDGASPLGDRASDRSLADRSGQEWTPLSALMASCQSNKAPPVSPTDRAKDSRHDQCCSGYARPDAEEDRKSPHTLPLHLEDTDSCAGAVAEDSGSGVQSNSDKAAGGEEEALSTRLTLYSSPNQAAAEELTLTSEEESQTVVAAPRVGEGPTDVTGVRLTTEGEPRSAHKERILEEICAWFNSGASAAGKKDEGDMESRRNIPVRISQRPPAGPSSSHQHADAAADQTSCAGLSIGLLLRPDNTDLHHGGLEAPRHNLDADGEFLASDDVSCTAPKLTSQSVSQHSAFSEAADTEGNGRLFSEVARASRQAEGSFVHGKNANSSVSVRTDHLCNQHLIPEQFRKLIVPDMDKMMQLGRDNAWDSHSDEAVSGETVDAVVGPGDGEKTMSSESKIPVTRAERSSSGSSSAHPSQTTRGIRITAEELFANYEAAVIGSRAGGQPAKATAFKSESQATAFKAESQATAFKSESQATAFKSESQATAFKAESQATAFKAEIQHEDWRASSSGSSSDSLSSTGKKQVIVGGFSTSSLALASPSSKSSASSNSRHQNPTIKSLSQSVCASGRAVGMDHKCPQMGAFGASSAVSRESRPGPLQQHQQQTLTFSSHSGKCREQVMTAAYYANTRLSDVMTYASINIPGLPRIPILSPQAAAHNAFMMKASNMRPCLQPNLSVPPPGFIPLMPVPTGPTFHHGPSAYPMGPIFQPGVFHSPNFIAMTPHPHAPTFMQQTKVNICANVNINSSVSTTFNVNSSNNRVDSHNPILTLNNNLRVTACSTSPTSTASVTTSTSDCSRKLAGAETKILDKATALGGWSPLISLKTSSSASMKGAEGPSGPESQYRGHGSPGCQESSDPKASGRHKSSSEPGRLKDEATGRSEQEKWKGQVIGDVSRPRGSNTGNLIHIYPPRH